MKNIFNAINEEKLYIIDKKNNIDTSLLERIKQYGYDNLDEYFKEKRDYFFDQWSPEVFYVDVSTLTEELEKAIKNKQYGVYISTTKGPYVFHGTDDIDYTLCKQLGVTIAELYYNGGTIVGDERDLGIEIVAPIDLNLDSLFFLNKFYELISKKYDNVIIDGNDILINCEKVLGSMRRNVGNVFVWAAQISFANHDELIQKLCHKKSNKKPGNIDEKITKEELQREVLRWLQKH